VGAARQPPVDEHPLPTCFVCGPARAKGDGLRIFTGPLARKSSNASTVLAATWTPASTLVSEDGLVAPEFLWSVLDCPTGYASSYDPHRRSFDRTPILLGRMSARIEHRPQPEERCVITAWATGRDGRKRMAEAALHNEAGTLFATARATWIVVDREMQLGCATSSPSGLADPVPGPALDIRERGIFLRRSSTPCVALGAPRPSTRFGNYRSPIGTYDRSAGFNQLLSVEGCDDAGN
jgi:hypothetical protein